MKQFQIEIKADILVSCKKKQALKLTEELADNFAITLAQYNAKNDKISVDAGNIDGEVNEVCD